MAEQDKKKIRLKRGSSMMAKEATVSEDGIYDLDKAACEIIEKVCVIDVEGKVLYLKGSSPTNEDIDKCVEIKGMKKKIYSAGVPDNINICNLEYINPEVITSQDTAGQSAAEKPGPLEESIKTAAETPLEKGYLGADETEEQLQILKGALDNARESGAKVGYKNGRHEGYDRGYKDAKEEFAGKKEGYEGRTQELEALLKQKDEDYAKERKDYEARLKEYEEAKKEYEAKLENMEETIKAHEANMQEKESEISQFAIDLEEYKGKALLLEEGLSEAREYAADQKEIGDKAEENVVEKYAQIKTLEQQIGELGGQITALSQDNEKAERKFAELEDESRNKIDALEIKQGKEIKEYEDMIKEKREKLSKAYAWMLKASEGTGLDEKSHPKERAAAIELMLCHRSNLMEEVENLMKETKFLRAELEQYKKSSQEVDIPYKNESAAVQQAEIPGSAETTEYTPDELFNKVVEYVIVSIHTACEGKKGDTLDKIDRLLSTFETVDPSKEKVEVKDLLILKDYFLNICGDYQNGQTADFNMLINLCRDEFEKILNKPEFSDGLKRVNMRNDLRDYYDEYVPKSTR